MAASSLAWAKGASHEEGCLSHPGLIAAVYLWNASWLAPAPENPRIRLIAYRGVHQTFGRSGIEADTCTGRTHLSANP